jgi:hypothetical protein
MDPRTDKIYAGIAGAKLHCAEVELGGGVTLCSTFAHMMAPFLMAFAQPEGKKPHPGPWSAVRGGLAFDIHLQLYIPEVLSVLPQWFDRLNTVWWIAALLRLRTGWPLQVPVIADSPFSEIPANWDSAVALPVEIVPRYSTETATHEHVLTEFDVQWLKTSWIQAGALMAREPRFNESFQAFDRASSISSRSLGLLLLWAALEHLFSPSPQELKFRTSCYIAAYLEPFGTKRIRLQREVSALYDARSRAAHKAGVDESEAFSGTLALFGRVLERMITTSAVPTRDDLDSRLLGEGTTRG